MATHAALASINLFPRPTQQQNKVLHRNAESSVENEIAP